MKLISKKNVIPVICTTYTIVSTALTSFEVLQKGEMNPTQLNMFSCLVLCIIGVGVLSQHYRFERFSPLTMIVMQYLIAMILIFGGLKTASCFTEIHPDGYRDMTVSFSIPYFIGAVIYYVSLRLQVRRQNGILEKIKKEKTRQNAATGGKNE